MNFSSIVVGFFGASLGILITIRESDVVKAIFETEEAKL